MAGPTELLREVISLTSNVQDLKENVGRLEEKVDENRERIVGLESREETIIEKAKNEFLQSSMQGYSNLIERVIHLEQKTDSLPEGKQEQLRNKEDG